MAEYISDITELVNALAGEKTSNNDIVLFALAGLGEDYDTFVQNVTTRESDVTFTQLQSMLLEWEIHAERNTVAMPLLTGNVVLTEVKKDGILFEAFHVKFVTERAWCPKLPQPNIHPPTERRKVLKTRRRNLTSMSRTLMTRSGTP